MKLVNCDIYKVIDIIKNKCTVCFGAGLGLSKLIDIYSDLQLEQYIDYVSDNDKNKKGTKRCLNQKEVPIIAPDEIKKLNNVVIIITCIDVYSIFCQLNMYIELQDVYCFVDNFIRSATNLADEARRNYPDTFRITSKPIIPKKIHYCWFGRNPIPEKNQVWMKSWERFCPNYEIIRWDETNYDISKNKYVYDAYRAKKWGFVSDYASLDIIYSHGGIYLDTDVELISSLDELLYQNAFAGIEESLLINLGLGFGGIKEFPIFREARDLYNELKSYKRDGSFNDIPAPTLRKEFFSRKGYKNNGEYQVVNGMAVYPEKVLSGKCFYTGRIMPTSHTIAIHHYDASWFSEEMRIKWEHTWKLFKEECHEL